MVTLPVARWEESIGTVAQGWLNDGRIVRESVVRSAASGDARRRDCELLPGRHVRLSDARSGDQAWPNDQRPQAAGNATLGELLRHFQTTAPGALSATQRVNELPVSEEQKAYLRGLIEERENDR